MIFLGVGGIIFTIMLLVIVILILKYLPLVIFILLVWIIIKAVTEKGEK